MTNPADQASVPMPSTPQSASEMSYHPEGCIGIVFEANNCMIFDPSIDNHIFMMMNI